MGSRIEGIATMSDVNGSLLCYSTGGNVWDALGNTVSKSLLGRHSATQASIIVPDPANSNEYYLFTDDKFAESGGLQYVKYDALTSSLLSGSVYQYEFSTSSLRTIGSASGISYNIGALQMGPDGKTYVSIDELDYLGVINDPEVAIASNGNDFSLAANQFTLTIGTARLGLPNLVQRIFIGKPNAIEDNELEVTIGLELYPSPTASTLSIQIDRTASKLTVQAFNTEGRMADVQVIHATGTMLELDVEQLSSGLYFAEVNADVNIAKGKFVRQ
jgi:WD40 repeat protein